MAKREAAVAEEKCGSVVLARVDPEQLAASCRAVEVDPTGLDTKQQIGAVNKWMRDAGGKDFADCTRCGGVCNLKLCPLIGDRCPFCGDGPEDGEVLTTRGETTSETTGGPAAAPTEDTVAKKTSAKAVRAAKAAKQAKGETALAVAPSGAIAEVDLPAGTVEDLDKDVKRAAKLKLALATNFWELGQVIADIHERKLWAARQIGDAQAYPSFANFCRAELSLSEDQCYRHIAVYRAFTADDVRAIGVSKLKLVLGVSGEYREKLLEAARAGASKSDIARAVDAANGKPAKPPEDRVTVFLALKRVTVPLYKRSQKKGEPVVAKSLKDDPHGEEQLANGVVQRYKLVQRKGGAIELVIERVRVAEPAAAE